MENDPHPSLVIDAVLAEIQQLRRAADLLKQVYGHIGPYEGSISYRDPVWAEVRDHFGFDDSE